jgi:hypothetical protein
MRTPTRGRLLHNSAAPVYGEHIEEVIHIHGVVIEQILSGVVDKPVDYDQDQDEWVVRADAKEDVGVSISCLVNFSLSPLRPQR